MTQRSIALMLLALLVLALPLGVAQAAPATVTLHDGQSYDFSVVRGDKVALSVSGADAYLQVTPKGRVVIQRVTVIHCTAAHPRFKLSHGRNRYSVLCTHPSSH